MSLEVGTSLKESIGGIISLSGRIWGKNFNNIIKKMQQKKNEMY